VPAREQPMPRTRLLMKGGLATLAFFLAAVFFFHYVPFDLASFAAWGGIFAVLLGLVCLVKPVRRLGIRSRLAALLVVIGSLFVTATAIGWPASVVGAQGSHRRLDDFLPRYQFAEYHEGRVRASRQRVVDAVQRVTVADMPAAVFLMRLRALAEGRWGTPPPDSRPILDVMSQPGTGFLPLDVSNPAEVVFGMAGRPWTGEPPPPVRTPEEFLAFSEPGHIRVAFDIRVRDEGDGTCLVSTETRTLGNDDEAQRVFARYWRLIYPGSAIIRRVWLDAIISRASRTGD
jgi:hypothetical protein